MIERTDIVYHGEKTLRTETSPEHKVVVKNLNDGGDRNMPKYLGVVDHSPTGFSWGYSGSGPAQLAFALIYHVTDEDLERTNNLYQVFKRDVVSELDDTWTLTQADIVKWIKDYEKKENFLGKSRLNNVKIEWGLSD